uniref:ILEI/PANDER domain-containing protein n=1 Tax=Xenopus tropicalis TaxID=8364 RepID=A0A1B8YAW1_XENTR
MSSIKNNIGKGLNIALINGFNGDLIKIASFDMYSGDVEPLVDFLKSVTDGTLVFVASYDDPSSKLNDEARAIFASFGSSYAEKLYFRDAWVFVGVKGTSAKSKFEQPYRWPTSHTAVPPTIPLSHQPYSWPTSHTAVPLTIYCPTSHTAGPPTIQLSHQPYCCPTNHTAGLLAIPLAH